MTSIVYKEIKGARAGWGVALLSLYKVTYKATMVWRGTSLGQLESRHGYAAR